MLPQPSDSRSSHRSLYAPNSLTLFVYRSQVKTINSSRLFSPTCQFGYVGTEKETKKKMKNSIHESIYIYIYIYIYICYESVGRQ